MSVLSGNAVSLSSIEGMSASLLNVHMPRRVPSHVRQRQEKDDEEKREVGKERNNDKKRKGFGDYGRGNSVGGNT